MTLHLEHDSQRGTLVARQQAPLLRYVIGVPLLLGGGIMLFGVVSSFIIQMQEKGVDGVLEALLGSFLLSIFAALLLPLGWWLTLSRHWVALETGRQEIREVSDWRIGRREKRTSTSAFRAVRVAREPLGSRSSASSSGRVVYGQTIRLLAKKPDEQRSIALGSLDETERERAVALGRQVADFLALPLDVAKADAALDSPEGEAGDMPSHT
jgi:hypothetical protein